ncbi:MAG: PAS domain-containing sensor histidine kinase [Clostridia bacterium]|nr:PAS domain-containing sensor histidine kinase [Clostridia bacterium]
MSVNEQASAIMENVLLVNVLNEMNVLVMILNEKAEIVFANKALLNFVNSSLEKVIGKKPGNIIKCKYANSSSNECGCVKQCKHCSVKNTIVEVINSGMTNEAPVTIISLFKGVEQTFNFHEKVSVLHIENEKLYLATFLNRDAEIVKNNLQRIFYHDILNSASSIYNIIEYLKLENHELALNKDVILLESSIEIMIEEIKYQKSISDAESNQLKILMENTDIIMMVNECVSLLKKDDKYRKNEITVVSESDELIYHCDRIILRRIIFNLLKNALEETKEKEEVKIVIESHDERILIKFHNDSVISEKVRKNIFTKGFSTKGIDRGFGLYGSKLLANKYLNGDISFVSNEKDRTVFTLGLCGGNK